MKCGACLRVMRKSRLAHVADGASLRNARVCSDCFDGAIHIVPHVTRVEKVVDKTRREASDAVAGATRKIRGIIRAYEVSGSKGAELDGLQQALDILQAGDF